MKYLALILLICSVASYNDWDCDPNWCIWKCCESRTDAMAKDPPRNETCYTPPDSSSEDSQIWYKTEGNCPGRTVDSPKCVSSDCSSGCCAGMVCTAKSLCDGLKALGCCYFLCVCAIALIPILLLVLILTLCMKPKRQLPPPGHQP